MAIDKPEHVGHNVPHKRLAKLLFKHQYVYTDGAIVAMKAWNVPVSPSKPEGIKYSLAYMDASRRRVLGYDNAEGKGHHRHEGDRETPFQFETIEALLVRFAEEVARIRRPIDAH